MCKRGERHKPLRSHSEAAAVMMAWNSEFVEKLHDSDGCALSKDEGSNDDGYDSPNC